jgi:hypothetical protein
MLKTAAIIFGIFFIVAGIGGFVGALAPDGMLFGIFMVGPVHNCIHLASGVVALLCAFAGVGAARKYFQIFASFTRSSPSSALSMAISRSSAWSSTTWPISGCISPSRRSRSSWDLGRRILRPSCPDSPQVLSPPRSQAALGEGELLYPRTTPLLPVVRGKSRAARIIESAFLRSGCSGTMHRQ